MFKQLIFWLFPPKFKVGSIVTCRDERCGGKECMVERVYNRGNDKVPYLRIKFIDELGRWSTINIKSIQCELIKD